MGQKRRQPPPVNMPPADPNVQFPVPVASLTAEDKAYLYFVSTQQPSWPFKVLTGEPWDINDAINSGGINGGYTYRVMDAYAYTGVLKGAPR